MTEKTCIIFVEVPEDVKYYVVDGDQQHLHGTYINDGDSSEDKQDELSNLIYDEHGNNKLVDHSISDFRKFIINNAYLIECGFIL